MKFSPTTKCCVGLYSKNPGIVINSVGLLNPGVEKTIIDIVYTTAQWISLNLYFQDNPMIT